MTLLHFLKTFSTNLTKPFRRNTSCQEKQMVEWLISKRNSRRWVMMTYLETSGSKKLKILKLPQRYLTYDPRMKEALGWEPKNTRDLISVRQNSFWRNSPPCSVSNQSTQRQANRVLVVLRSRLMPLITTLFRPTWLGRKLRNAAKWWIQSLRNLIPMVLFVPAICSLEPKVAECPASNPTTSKSPETKPSVSVWRLLIIGFLWMLILVRWNFDWLLRSRKTSG